ncbi:GyrI-like domain-containing protein [Paenibacillus sp. MWE-103]|uniref:GyrI-like domain-containing protein n=1 Tax=Paenibacillus artemisiicola TaxID=1172618 RepID=A0ABS3W9F1_9BACL|nr:GyrI-like domain-containing protein [Paenibacillus artemisiicola]MBO7744949.1 GyrI-like domain-containing protein [Paenibacillus artemisiicola]
MSKPEEAKPEDAKPAQAEDARPEDVRIVMLPHRSYVGMALTSAFASHDPKRAELLQKQFISRRFEIKGMTDSETYVCPSFVCEQLFTYLFCKEVSRIADVPEGMIGFEIPEGRYAKVRAKHGDPYDALHAFLRANGLRNDPRGMSLEAYRVHRPKWPDEVDVYVPLLET